MPTPEEIASEQEKLYESSSLRDDLNDDEATVLLNWGQTQVEQIAKTYPDDFEQKARFLRQLIKNINRFVGQREFNDINGQREYMEKVVKFLEPLGYTVNEKDLFAALPADPKDMMANLKSILKTLSPAAASTPPEDPAPPVAVDPQSSNPPSHEQSPIVDASLTQNHSDNPEAAADSLIKAEISGITDPELANNLPTFSPNIDRTEVIPDISYLVDVEAASDDELNKAGAAGSSAVGDGLENTETGTINQPDNAAARGAKADNDQTDE